MCCGSRCWTILLFQVAVIVSALYLQWNAAFTVVDTAFWGVVPGTASTSTIILANASKGPTTTSSQAAAVTTTNNHNATTTVEKLSLARSQNDDSLIPRSRSIPSFANGTGVAIFYHLPKTGGTSIRESVMAALKNYTNNRHGRRYYSERVQLIQRDGQLQRVTRTIEQILSGQEKDLLFVELHGNLPGLVDLSGAINRWRHLAASNGVPMFTFTLLREPTMFHVSYFRFFHRPGCTFFWCEKDLYNVTEDNLVKVAVPNHQCMMLTRGQENNKKNVRMLRRGPVSKAHCDRARRQLQQDWDWVGTTEGLGTVTLPLVLRVMFPDATSGITNAVAAVSHENKHTKGVLSNLRPATEEHLRKLSMLDVDLYRSVQKDYRLIVNEGDWSKSTIATSFPHYDD